MGGENKGHFYEPILNGLDLKCRVAYYTENGTLVEHRFRTHGAADVCAAQLVMQGYTVTVSCTYKGFPKEKPNATTK